MTHTSASQCLTEEVLQHLLNGTLAEAADVLARRHLNHCEPCRQKMEGLLEAMDDEIPALSSTRSADIQPWMGQILSQIAEHHESRPLLPPPCHTAERIAFPDECPGGRFCGRLDEFDVVEHIASGATGHLYKAWDRRLERTVAIKVLRAELCVSAMAKQRFLREANAIARLDSEFIVNVYDVRERCDFPPYLVMEFIDGPSLQQKIEDGARRNHTKAVTLICQILDGLAAAHGKSVIHRDVKPGNILLPEASEKGAKLVDFGLARLDEQSLELTSPGSIAGTPAYMAPEQIVNAHEANEQSDVYSAGVVLYELLTGDLPFRGSFRMVLHQVLHVEPQALRSLDDEIPRDLQTVCLKAMAKLPGQRYESAVAFRDDLLRWQSGLPVLARPVGVVGRYLRWKIRNPAVANLTLLVAGLILTLLVMWGRFTFEATTARHELEIRNRDLRESYRLKQEANDRSETERAVAIREADRANQQANLAFRVLNRLTFGVQNALADRPLLQQQILNASIADLQKLSAEVTADSPVSLTLAVAYLRLGEASQKTGDSKAAASCYRHVQQTLDSMSAEFRQQPDVLQCQVWLHLSQAALAQTDGHKAVEWAELQAAITACRQIEDLSPGRIVTMHAGAVARLRMAGCVDEPEGARMIVEAIELLRRCVELDDSAQDVRFDLAVAMLQQASSLESEDASAADALTWKATDELMKITSDTQIKVDAINTAISAMEILTNRSVHKQHNTELHVLRQRLRKGVHDIFQAGLIDTDRQANFMNQLGQSSP